MLEMARIWPLHDHSQLMLSSHNRFIMFLLEAWVNTDTIAVSTNRSFVMKRWNIYQFSSVAQSCLTLQPHESQHARPPCPSPTPRGRSESCPSSQWCHPAISSSVVPFSSCPQSLPASKSFPMSQLFAWGGQRTGVSALASFLPKKSQGCSPSG